MSTEPAALVDFVNVPQWVAWRNEMRNGKITKVPYCSATRQAEADDATTWLPHDQAVLIAEAVVNGSGGGIGIELGQCGEAWIAGIDLDTCRDPISGIIEPWASAVIDRLGSYTEVSPSETGVKVFFLIDPDDVPVLRHIMDRPHGRQFKRANGSSHPPSIELYLSNRYFTVTWEGIPDAPAELRVVPMDDLRWLIEEAGPDFSGKAEHKHDSTNDTCASISILDRLDIAAKHSKPLAAALLHASTMRGGSRSEGAFGLGAALKRAGWTFEDMKAALRACPATRDWAGAADDRQFERTWARSDDQTTGEQPNAPGGQSWRALDLPSFEGVTVPDRRWIVPHWLPVGVVTLCYADGGIGKTLLGLQLMAATALNSRWCGLRVTPCNSIGLFSEDDATELHIRMDAIRQHYGASWSDLRNMHPVDATGQDNVLIRVQSDGTMVPTPRFAQLREQALDTKARLVVIDTAATCFAGNENDRAQVTGFVGNFLTSLAQDIDGAVLLNAHPSLSGLASGDLRSGSTAWNNSCRSRWGLARPEDDEGKPILDSPERILTRRKANAASTGDFITMEWRNGVLLVPETYTAGSGSRKDQAEAAFLAALAAKRAAGIHVSANSRAGNYAPKVLYNTPEGRDFSKRELIDAMGNLMKRGCLKTQTYKHNYEAQEELVKADK